MSLNSILRLLSTQTTLYTQDFRISFQFIKQIKTHMNENQVSKNNITYENHAETK